MGQFRHGRGNEGTLYGIIVSFSFLGLISDTEGPAQRFLETKDRAILLILPKSY
jgi:hypothetical protein